MVIDIETQRPILSHGSGGLSGKAIHPIAVKKMFDLYKIVRIPIFGCGGVFTGEDAIEFFLAGASAVQIGSALYQDYNAITNIINSAKKYLEVHNYKSFSDIVGNAHKFETQEAPDF